MNIIADWLVIPRFGYLAAAYVTFGCYVLFFLLHLLHVHKLGGGRLVSGPELAAGCACVLAAALVSVLLREHTAVRILLAIAAVCGAGAALYSKKAFGGFGNRKSM